jgi:hypothetical protein
VNEAIAVFGRRCRCRLNEGPFELARCVDNRPASLFFMCALIHYSDCLSVRLIWGQPFYALLLELATSKGPDLPLLLVARLQEQI